MNLAPPRCLAVPAAHTLHWWRTETLMQVRWARRAVLPATRQWNLGQAEQARAYVRELQRRHPGVAPCSCHFPKMDPEFRPNVYPPFPPRRESVAL